MGSLSIPLVLPRIEDPELSFTKYLNLLLLLMERSEGAIQVEGRPFEITIDLATLCQLRCPYCETGAGTMERTKGVLRPDMHRRMLDELSETTFLVWYFSTGEPLLNKQLPEIVGATRDSEIYSVISTNLSLPLSDERIDALLTCGLGCISVSLDGASPETYARYRVGGDFDLVTRNMRRLVARKRELGLELPHIEWRFLVFKHNQHEVARARELASEWGVDLLEFFTGYAPPDASGEEVQLADPVDLAPNVTGPAVERAQQRPETLLLRSLDNGEHPPPPPEADSRWRTKCDWLYFGSTLFPNGSVSPCCLSNAERDDFGVLEPGMHFDELWNNDRYREARSLWVDEAWRKSDLVCGRCPNRDAQDWQFRTTIQAVLRNAPDWVLHVLAADADRFFKEIDFIISPAELLPMRDGRLATRGSSGGAQAESPPSDRFADIDARLAAARRSERPDFNQKIEWIRKALARAS